jgi:WD40 repeat protein
VTLWNVKAHKPRGDPLKATRYITLIAYSPGGRQVAVAGVDGSFGPDRVKVWRTADLRARPRVFGAETSIRDARFTADGSTLLATDLLGDVEAWGMRGPARQHAAHGSAFAAGRDGPALLLAKDRDGMRIVDAGSGRPLGPRLPLTDQYFAAAGPGGHTVAQGSLRTLTLWNVRGSKVVEETLPADQGRFATPVFSPDGTRLATVGADGTVKLWLARDPNPLGRELAPAPRGLPDVTSVALGPRGTAAGGGGSSVTIWAGDAAKRHEATGGAAILAFSPNGRLLATGGGNGGLTFWDPTRQRRVASLPGPHRDIIGSLQFSADGDRLTSRSADGVVAVWDTSGPKPTLHSHTKAKTARPPGCPGDDPSGKYA